MKKKDNTHELIKCLTKSEKRYVKLYASTYKKDSELSRMFSILEKQDEYDERPIIEEFGGKQVHVIKNRLNLLILKSMRAYHSKSNVRAELTAILQDANFLFDRGLYNQSYKMVKKGIELAVVYEKFNFLLELLQLEQKIDGKELNLSNFFKSINKSKDIINLLINQLDSKQEAFKIYDLVVRLGSIMSSEEASKYKEDLEEMVNRDFAPPLSFKASYFLNSALAMSYNLLGDYEKYYYHYSLIIKKIEANPSIIKDQTIHYISTLNNIINACFALKKFDEIELTIQKMRNIKHDLKVPEDSYVGSSIFLLSYDAELTLLIQKGEYEKGLNLLPQILDGLKTYKEKNINIHVLDIYYQIAYLYFGVEDYRKSIKWLNRILNESETNIREDLHCMGRIFNLVLHIELGNQVILDYVLDQHTRFLSKKKRYYQFEKTVLSYLKQIIKTKDVSKRDAVWIDFLPKLEELSKDVYIQRALSYFDVKSWIESKISKIPFREVVKAKSYTNTLV